MVGPAITLPKLVFGSGTIARLGDELALLGVARPFLISDHGLERAGLVARVSGMTAVFLDVAENPVAAGVDAAAAAYRAAGCDGVVALGGGSVLDTAKMVAAMGITDAHAFDLIGHYGRIAAVAPLVVVPTTVGTGSDSSPVAAIHREHGGPAIGTRGPMMVPRVAILDPDLVRTLPPRLIAATAVDALSHCIEGYFAEPANPIVDALALDGIARVFADVEAALLPKGDAARASLMAAAFAGGAAIHKGIGLAHAIATTIPDDAHHGTLIGVALPHTTELMARMLPAKAGRVAAAMGVAPDCIGKALAGLIARLDLPVTLAAAGARAPTLDAVLASPVNGMSPYRPTADDYRTILAAIG